MAAALLAGFSGFLEGRPPGMRRVAGSKRARLYISPIVVAV